MFFENGAGKRKHLKWIGILLQCLLAQSRKESKGKMNVERKTRRNVNTHSFWNYLFCPHATTQYDKIDDICFHVHCQLLILFRSFFSGLHFRSHSFLRKNSLILRWHVSKRIMLDIMTERHCSRKRSNASAPQCFAYSKMGNASIL